MKPNSPIFESASMRLIESFAPHFHKILNEFEDNNIIGSRNHADHIIENIFQKFPRENQAYLKLIQTLTKLSSFDPPTTLLDLTNLFLNILNQNENSLFQVLQNTSLIFKHGNIYHQEILTKFSIYLTTDLICQVLREYGYNESCEHLITCGVKISENQNIHKLINDSIINQWSVIFSFISETNFQLVFEMFNNIINAKEFETAFYLIQYIRLDKCNEEIDLNFLSKIYEIITMLQKENKLTETILKAISNLLQTQKKYCRTLDDLFELIWGLRNESTLQCEAINIICVLFPLLPSKKDQKSDFYEKYVLTNLDDRLKIQKKLHLFQILIYGIQYDPRWFCWEWGISPRLHQYSYLRWNSQPSKPFSDPTSFLSIFMRTFFNQADFSVCYEQFSDILLHFAALDFPYFIENVMDSFLSVPNTDPRFVSFLMMIPKVNTPDFIDYASKTVTFSDIGTFNEKIKPKVIEALSVFSFEFLDEHGICGDRINAVEAMIFSSDQKVEKILEEWRFFKFKKTVTDHSITKESNVYNPSNILQVNLAKCLPFIIPIEDYSTTEMMRLILQLSFNSSLTVSSVAFPICQSIITDDSMQIKFIEIILEYIKGPTSCESLFTCINFLNEMLLSNPQELPIDVLHNIEFAGIRGSVSVHPSCRTVSVKLLKMVNFILGGHGCFNFVELNIEEIERIANRQLFSHYLSDSNMSSSSNDGEMNSDKASSLNSVSHQSNQNHSKSSNKIIKFNQAACSHYFDIWLYFVSEIANIIVSVNYSPLLERFRTNLDCYISALISANSDNISPDSPTKKKSNFYSYPDFSSGDITSLFTPTSADSQMNVGLLTYYLAAHFDIDYLMKLKNLYKCQLHHPLKEKDKSLQEKVLTTMKSLFNVEGLRKLSFAALKHAHISLAPLLISFLCNSVSDQYENSAAAVRIMLLSPSITPSFARILFKSIIPFISMIQKFLIAKKINSSSPITWNDEMEMVVSKFKRLSIDFCIIIGLCLKKICGSVSFNEWPLQSREIIFVFMMNWIKTKSANLQDLRFHTSNTLITILNIGPMFQNPKLFDQTSIEIISSIDKNRSSILSSVLFHHVELLLDKFINSFYMQSMTSSDLILSSIFAAFDAEYSDFLYKKSAPLLLLGFVIHMRKNPRSYEYLSAIVDLITQGKLSIEKIEDLVQVNNDKNFENGIPNMDNRCFIPNSPSNDFIRTFGQPNEMSANFFSQMSRSRSSISISKYAQNDLNSPVSINWFDPKTKASNNDSVNSPSESNVSMTNRAFTDENLLINELLIEISKQLIYATEAVFEEGFKILKFKNLRISVKEIVDVLIIWSGNIHLLPNQQTCLEEISSTSEFHRFTPYEFLDQLVKTTKIVGNSNISSMISLWVSLMKIPYHLNLIPIYLFDFNWKCPNYNNLSLSFNYRKGNSKQQILSKLISVEPETVIMKVAQRCSFAYFYYVTVSLKKSFDDELWIVPLLTEAFQSNINKKKYILQNPSIINFAILFVENGTSELLRVLCNAMNIEIPNAAISYDILISIIKKFVIKFDSENKIDDVDYIEIWGIEVVKWILGSSSLHFTLLSLLLFNQLLKPIEPFVINGVCKAILFHINQNKSNIDQISQLIQESFIFYNSVFEGNEKFVFSYALSFIDCKLFVETCLDTAAEIFMKSLMCDKTSETAWKYVISMIRPLLHKLEADKKTQKMFELLIKYNPNVEILMTILPIHLCHRELFRDCLSNLKLIHSSSSSSVQISNEPKNSSIDPNYVNFGYLFNSNSNPSFSRIDDQLEFNQQIENILSKVNEITLSKTLTHYASMIKTASLDLKNSIFIISSYIVQHVSTESNKEALEIIYKNALKVFPYCPNSIDFISAIVNFNLNTDKKEVASSFESERSIDSVLSSLSSLLIDFKVDDTNADVTDCVSIQSVYNLLNCDVAPKISPFDEQKNIIEQMKFIRKSNQVGDDNNI